MSFFEDASLVLIPSGIKNQKIYSVKPTDGSGDLTFSRASSATRVASNGLIEKVRTNLLTYSEDMVTGKIVSNVTATNNVTTAPDGTTTAASVEADAVSTAFIRTSANFGAVNFSVYLKYDSQQFVQIIISGDAGCFVNFDIQNGVIGDAGAKATNVQIENVGNGWYRCSAYLNPAAAGSLRVYHVSSLSAGHAASLTIIGNTYFTWGWQAEDGDIATDYIATTTTAVSVGPVSGLPRLDYLNSSCPRLLLEPQRTNSVTYSENFDNAAWDKTRTTVSANSLVSPDGNTNADTLVADVGTATTYALDFSTLTGTGIFTASVFAKKGNSNWMYIRQGSSGGGTTITRAWFDLNNGTIGITSPAAISHKIEDYGNGWYRCSMTFEVKSGGIPRPQFYISTGDGVTTFDSDGTQSINLWGAQCELGAYATSYIPTLGASVTRVKDAASKTGISALIGQTEGTLFAEVDFSGGLKSQPIRHIFNISDGTDNNRLNIFIGDSSTEISFYLQTPSSIITAGLSLPNITKAKIAAAYKSGSSVLYINGVLAVSFTDSFAFAASLGQVTLGTRQNFTNELGDGVNQALLFKTRLTNAQLAELTA